MVQEKKREKALEGVVVSNKMEKTIVVRVARRLKHPVLGKIVRRSKQYKAHVEGIDVAVGDWVEICECRPLSKTKHMVLKRIIRKKEAAK